MAAASIYYSLLQAALAAVQALALTYQGNAIPADVRKLPTARQKLDGLPRIAVVPTPEPESVEPWSSENEVEVIYKVDVALFAAGDRDPVTNLDNYLNWRQQLRTVLQQTLPAGVSSVYRVRCRPMKPVDESEFNANYDLSGLTILFHSIEQAS